MKRQMVIWGVVLLTVVNVASLATIGYHRFVQGDEEARRHRHRSGVSLYERLGLSEQQTAQMNALRKALEEKIAPLREALGERRERFFALMTAAEPDRQAIDRLQAEMDSLQAEIKRHVTDHMLDQKKLLTPEQQAQYFSIIQKRYSSYRRR